MSSYTFALLAHVDAGKTSLSESILYKFGTINNYGRVDHQDSFLDYDNQERKRGITIYSKLARFKLNGDDYTIIDTPGHVDFTTEMERSLMVLDFAILIVDANNLNNAHTKTIWKLLNQYHIPTYIFVNKMDLAYLSKASILKNLSEFLDNNILDFSTIDDKLIENVATLDEELMNKYLETASLDDADIAHAIYMRKVYPVYFGSALKQFNVKEFIELVNRFKFDIQYGDEFKARVFKINNDKQGNIISHIKLLSGSLKVKEKLPNGEKVDQIRLYNGDKYESTPFVCAGDICTLKGPKNLIVGEMIGEEEDKTCSTINPFLTYEIEILDGKDVIEVNRKLNELMKEDPSLNLTYQDENRSLSIDLMGEIQIEVLRQLIKERFDILVDFKSPHIQYKETINGVVEGVGHYEPLRHYAEVHLLLEGLSPNSGLVIENTLNENDIPLAIQKSIINYLNSYKHRGVLANLPLTDIKISLIGAKYSLAHSDGLDFIEATRRALRHGLMYADSYILEPIFDYRLEVPETALSKAMYDLERMEAKYSEPVIKDKIAIIRGSASVAKMQNYQSELNTYTKGQGRIYLSLKDYEACINQDEVINTYHYDPIRDIDNPCGSVFCAHGAGFYVPYDEVENYMHIKYLYNPEVKHEQLRYNVHKVSDEELKRVLSNANPSKREKYVSKKREENNEKYQSKVAIKPKCLVVDGYNMIYAWDELKYLAHDNLEMARNRLIDLLSNYHKIKNTYLIIVFDAYRVKDNSGHKECLDNMEIVYTKSNEIADAYIERETHNLLKKYQVMVATDDHLEQVSIFSQGATRISARALYQDVVSQMKRSMANAQAKTNAMGHKPLADIKDKLKDIDLD